MIFGTTQFKLQKDCNQSCYSKRVSCQQSLRSWWPLPVGNQKLSSRYLWVDMKLLVNISIWGCDWQNIRFTFENLTVCGRMRVCLIGQRDQWVIQSFRHCLLTDWYFEPWNHISEIKSLYLHGCVGRYLPQSILQTKQAFDSDFIYGGLQLLEKLAQDKRLNAVDYFIKEPLFSSASTIVTSQDKSNIIFDL